MSLSIGISSSERVINRGSSIVPNTKETVNLYKTKRGGCYMCEYDTTVEEETNGIFCKCPIKSECDGKKHYKLISK